MATDGGKSFAVVLGIIGLGALVYFLTRDKTTQPVPYTVPQTRWSAVPRVAPETNSQTGKPPESAPEPKVLYQNEERISLVRDADGRIQEFIVHRRVTADG